VERSLGARTAVADDVVDQRLVEHPDVPERVHETSHVVVGVLEEAGVDLHLSGQDRFELRGRVVPRGDLLVPGRELAVGRHDAQLLLAGQRLLAHRVPSPVEPTPVLVRPLLRNVVRGMGRAGGEVDEEGLVGHERLLLADPGDRLVRQSSVK
jgi:hypothetical protein